MREVPDEYHTVENVYVVHARYAFVNVRSTCKQTARLLLPCVDG